MRRSCPGQTLRLSPCPSLGPSVSLIHTRTRTQPRCPRGSELCRPLLIEAWPLPGAGVDQKEGGACVSSGSPARGVCVLCGKGEEFSSVCANSIRFLLFPKAGDVTPLFSHPSPLAYF